jgi:hypothetical protein
MADIYAVQFMVSAKCQIRTGRPPPNQDTGILQVFGKLAPAFQSAANNQSHTTQFTIPPSTQQLRIVGRFVCQTCEIFTNGRHQLRHQLLLLQNRTQQHETDSEETLLLSCFGALGTEPSARAAPASATFLLPLPFGRRACRSTIYYTDLDETLNILIFDLHVWSSTC